MDKDCWIFDFALNFFLNLHINFEVITYERF